MRRAALGCFAAAALAPAKRDWRCAFDAAFAGDFDNYAQVAAAVRRKARRECMLLTSAATHAVSCKTLASTAGGAQRSRSKEPLY